LRIGAPWRDLPPDYGGWKNTQRRFCRWRDKGLWERLLETFVTDPDFEWLFIDATHVKTHAHGTGAKGGTQEVGRTKGGLTRKYTWPWMLLIGRSEFLLRRVSPLIARELAS
jgi:transposase